MWRRRRRSTWCVHPLSCRTGQSTCQSSVSLTTRGHSLTSDALTSAQRTIVLTLWQKYHQPYQPKDIVWCVHSVRLVGNKMPPGLCLFLIYSDSVDVFVSVLLKRSRHPRFAFQTLSKILAQKRDYDCDAAFTTNTAQMIIDEFHIAHARRQTRLPLHLQYLNSDGLFAWRSEWTQNDRIRSSEYFITDIIRVLKGTIRIGLCFYLRIFWGRRILDYFLLAADLGERHHVSISPHLKNQFDVSSICDLLEEILQIYCKSDNLQQSLKQYCVYKWC